MPGIVRRVLQACHYVEGVTGLALGGVLQDRLVKGVTGLALWGGVTGQTLNGVTGLALGRVLQDRH